MNRDDEPIVEPVDIVDAQEASPGAPEDVPESAEAAAEIVAEPAESAEQLGRLLEDARAKVDEH